MKKIALTLGLLISFTSLFATGANWTEGKTCAEGYKLMVGQAWSSGNISTFFQVNLSGDALTSLENQLGESFAPYLQVTSDRFGYFTGKQGNLRIEIEEKGSTGVSLNIYDRQGERVADYQFYNCR